MYQEGILDYGGRAGTDPEQRPGDSHLGYLETVTMTLVSSTCHVAVIQP